MAGKSSKGRNKKGSHHPVEAVAGNVKSAEPVVSAYPIENDKSSTESSKAAENGEVTVSEVNTTEHEVKEANNQNPENQEKQGESQLYTVPVKTLGREKKLDLQLSPGDYVMDVRLFLRDAPETCFVTCYDLLFHAKDGTVHHLEDYHEIIEVADVTSGGCSLEMVAALYDDRSIRSHVHRTRELLSLSTLHSSLSTSLALQHEAAKNASATSGESNQTEVSKLESLGFMEDVSDSLANLLSTPSKEIRCVESIVFSSLNPPPSYRRLVGDLIYLDVETLEGNKYCITGNKKTFYVNSSSGDRLDPKPSKIAAESTTLVELLKKISSKFKTGFDEILKRKGSAHPFENVQSLLPPNSWLGLYPVPDHNRDAARAENALTLSFGSELTGMQRDWNEELQCYWEFPHGTPQERILRDTALYKVTSHFVDAATSGAIGVIGRCIPPINPTDPECFHMYVHNNIFFSFAVDEDLEHLPRKQSAENNLKSEKTNSSQTTYETVDKISDGAITVNGDKSSGENGDNFISEVAVDLSAEAQLAESEQATYASANNDLKGTKSYQEADVPGLYNLAMAIIDYRGHRVVAQSVLPGILQGDKLDSLLYGSVDNGKKICSNEEFHSKVLEASKRLHIKEHTVLDGSGAVFKLAAPVECKGIVGSDDRHYLLDLMRVTPRDANYTGPGSRFCILRPELIAAYCQAKEIEQSKSKAKPGDSTTESESHEVKDGEAQLEAKEDAVVADIETQNMPESEKAAVEECGSGHDAGTAKMCEDILFNPNVFTDFKLAGSNEEIEADEENVRKVSLYLRDVVLPKFNKDLCSLEVSPMDGQTLTDALHAHGINVRYIGKVANGAKQLPHLWDLCLNEIVVRSAKHIFKDFLRNSDDYELGPAMSRFLNCLFGNCQALSGKGVSSTTKVRTPNKDHSVHQASGKSTRGHGKLKQGVSAERKPMQYTSFTSDSLWSDILEFAKVKYQFDLPVDARSCVKKISVMRNFCQKVGLAVASRKYDLSAALPFSPSDIINLQPVVKHSIPVCSVAKDLVETGKIQLAKGLLGEAYSLFSEAFTILQQVTGPMHREVANCCRYLAMVLYREGDMAGAIMQQHRELIINERCLGLDHPATAHSYSNMALLYHGLGQTELALRHMSRALLLLSLSSGPDHPDVAATFINVAMMYRDTGKMSTALRYLHEALKKNERLLGEEHIQTAVCYHALAIAFNCMGSFKLSHQHEKKTYDILVKQLGEEDSRSRDSQNWMNTFKMRELQMTAQKQKGQTLNAASTQKAIDILKAYPDLVQAFQAASASNNVSGSANKTLNAAMVGEAFPRGRGVDERAARAAAEARKKAAARGLSIRPHGISVPGQASSQVPEIYNISNQGIVPNVRKPEEADKTKKVNGHPSGGSENVRDGEVKLEKEDETLAGLSGSSLPALGAEKKKSKAKIGS